MTLGPRAIQAAITAGIMFKLFPEIISRIDISALPDTLNPAENPQALAFALFGLGALTYARHPEGIIEYQTAKSLGFVNRRILRRPDPEADDGRRRGRDRARRGGVVSPTTLLEAERVTKRFAGITALNGASLRVDEGEIVGLIGPNGAGKTTLFDCIYGYLRPDGGQVRFCGET